MPTKSVGMVPDVTRVPPCMAIWSKRGQPSVSDALRRSLLCDVVSKTATSDGSTFPSLLPLDTGA